MKVLVYERDLTLRQWLTAGLRSRGHSVTTCADAEAALRELMASGHRLMLIDWTSPEGLRLCRKVRATAAGERCVVLASGLSDRTAELAEALAAGADDYLPKPSDAGTLHARLAVAERRQLRHEECAHTEEQALWFRKALDTVEVGVTITDAAGKVVYLNRAEAEMHGYDRDEILGQSARQLGPPETWKQLRGDELAHLDRWKRETLQLRKDGTRFSAELVSDVVFDPLGRALGLVTVCEDVSERKRAEPALREAEESHEGHERPRHALVRAS